MLRRIVATILLVAFVGTSQLDGATLTAGSVALQPGTTATLVVSGDIAGESAFGVTLMVEIVPRAGTTGTVTFTPAALPIDVDIAQMGDPWPGAGIFTALDTDASGSTALNGSVDDNGTFVPGALTFSGSLTGFPIVASADALGVWDVVLSTSLGDSAWEGTATTILLAGTITVFQGECFVNADCTDSVGCTDDTCVAGTCVYTPNNANCIDDGLFCTGAEVCNATVDCTSSGDPCLASEFCNDTTDTCDQCTVAGDCDDSVACTDDTCAAGSCVNTPNDANCPGDGLFCNGAEVCDAVLSCVSPGDPCAVGAVCDETNDICTSCVAPVDCDDGNVCTDDTCNVGVCEYTDNTAACDDGLFCTVTDVCSAGACAGVGDPCPGQVCDDVLNACVGASASLTVESMIVAAGATENLVVAGQIAGFDTYGVSLFVELTPRAGNTGTMAFTVAPPSDIAQMDDPWPGLGTFSTFDTDATASTLLNGSIDDNGTFVAGPINFGGRLVAFPLVASGDAGGTWDVALATSAGNSSWEGVTTTLAAGTITIKPPVSISVNSFAMPPSATANLVVSGEVQGMSTFGVSVMAELIPRAGAVGTLSFTSAPPVDVAQLADPWPGAGSFTAFDTDLTASTLLNGSVDDNGSFIPAPLTFLGDLSAFPVIASADANGIWDVSLNTTAGLSAWENLTSVLFEGTITVTVGACVLDAECNDANSCTTDLCNAGVCEYAAVVGACDDGDPCNVGETCMGSVCQGAVPVDCSTAGDQCNTASCDSLGVEGNCGVLTPVLDGTACVDLDVCNVGETCQAGTCTGGGPVDCSTSGNECNTAACDAAGAEGNCSVLTPVLDGTPCVGTAVCTVNEACLAGVCSGGGPVDCATAGDSCNTASCDPVGTVEGNCDTMTPFLDGTPCVDGDPCNVSEACQLGVCTGGGPVDCIAAGTQCSPASCDPVGLEGNCTVITQLPDGTGCDDALFCTVTDTCATGICTGVGDPCTALVLVCDEGIDSCVDCVVDADCDDANPCTDDACVSRTCVNTNHSRTCDDADACTIGDMCSLGACVPGTPVDCSGAGDQCNTATCDPVGLAANCAVLTPVANGTVCDDVDACTINDDCQAGICAGAPKDCSAFTDPCNVGSCNSLNGVCFASPANEGSPCDDGLVCTTNDACASGTCTGTLSGTPVVHLTWSPLNQVVQVGQTVRVDLIAQSGACVTHPAASIEVILQWNPAVLSLMGRVDTGPFNWLSSGFPNDAGLDGLNAPFTGLPANDGNALYQAIATFQGGAPVSPGGLVVTSFDFLALDGTAGTPLDIVATIGSFSATRVLGSGALSGVDLTGNLGSASVEIDECLTGAECDDGNGCTTDVCNGGVCEYTNNTLPCDDGVFCTAVDTCTAGVCIGSGDPCTAPLLCSESLAACVECLGVGHCVDGNICTDDICDATGTCQHPANSLPCDDGFFCTANDVCNSGVCTGSGDACPVSVCDEPNDRCVQCLSGGDCNDGNGCTDDICTANVCQNPENTLPCNDGLFCTVTDICSGGVCLGSVDPCVAPALCSEAFGQCVQCLSDVDCREQPIDNICTTDVCIFGVCSRTNNASACDDGLFCTATDTCSAGVCVGAGDACVGELCDEPNDACVQCFTVADCVPDAVACTDDACVAGDCTFSPNDTLCDDGLFCNGAEFCSGLVGCGTPGSPCDDPSLCDEVSDTCGCRTPMVVAEGSRYLSVTPRSGLTPVALVVSGVDPSVACMSLYVQQDGTLDSIPVFQTPGAWGTMHVRGVELRPDTTYAVQSECDTGAGLDRSMTVTDTLWRWADVNGSGGNVDVLDMALAVDGFRGIFVSTSRYGVDQWGETPTTCMPDTQISIIDVTHVVDGFRGFSFPCAIPCP